MGGGWLTACLVFAVLAADVRGEGSLARHGDEQDRWSRPATPERRQGDWVPLTCVNCRPIVDQGVQASNSLPSVLTPPPRVEEARLLPPPPPPDGLFQQAATGFLQAFTQQQPPPRNPQQFLQETSAQSINRPQAQVLKLNPANSKRTQQFLQEPSPDFQPPQQPQQLSNQQSNRQPQLLNQFNQQQFVPENGAYLNQPLFVGPQFVAAPFFPQPVQNIQSVNPAQIQPQIPISPNAVPINKQNFQIPSDRPLFVQQIIAGSQEPPSAPQQVLTQTLAPQQQYSVNETNTQKDEGEREEVQLLYVPVETLNQRARNLGRSKSLPSSQQDVTAQQVVGTESNRFTSPGQNYEFSNRKPHLEDQENFNTQTHTSKHHYNIKQNVQYQEQLPPEDQEKFNTQTHSVREQFNLKQNDQFEQPHLENKENFKAEAHNTKQQYNFKPTDQYQQQTQHDREHFNSQFSPQQNSQFQQQPPLDNSGIFEIQAQNLEQQHGVKLNDQYQTQQDQVNFNAQTLNANQQFETQQNDNTFQQKLPPVQQHSFNTHGQTVKQQFNTNQNPQYQQQLQVNQQAFTTPEDQPYINQPLQFNQQLSTEQAQIQQQVSTQQTQSQQQVFTQQTQSQQQFDLPEIYQQTNSPITQTRVPDAYTTQQSKKQRLSKKQKPLEQDNLNAHGQTVKQQFSNNNQNPQYQQLQVNQQAFATVKEQPYVNQPIRFDQEFSTKQAQTQQQVSNQHTQSQQQVPTQQTQSQQQVPTQQTQSQQQVSTQQPQSQQQFDLPETHQQTNSPKTLTRVPDRYTTQQSRRQRLRKPQQDTTRNVQQFQNSQFVQQSPQDYQQPTAVGSNLSPSQNVDALAQVHNIRHNQQQSWSNQQDSNQHLSNQQKNSNEQQYDIQQADGFLSDRHQVSSQAPPPPSSTLPPPQTTPAPNQPPLSVYMETTEDSKITDVLRLLKNAKTIQVLDTVGPESPQVFVGPSNLKAPTGYIKFELPYLNSLGSNRVERKVDNLPFFVAPLNFNPPPGYSKIPFPAPHIGSVVVSNVTVLKTALHEKLYDNVPEMISSTERYLDQFTLPAEISPISPQLPSLINSLQDEIYSASTTAFPSTTTEKTTTAYTTQSYRGRGSSRGSHRGSSSYSTSTSPTRRPQSRTRRPYDGRPYSRRQPITTTTTTEPSTEAPVQQQFTPQSEQLAFNSEAYVQNTAAPVHLQTGNSQPNLQSDNAGAYYEERFVANNFNQDQFASQQQQVSQPIESQNIQQVVPISNTHNVEQYHKTPEVTQFNYEGEGVSHTTAIPTVASPDIQREEQTFKSQRTTGSRRDPSRQHQRFRSRQRLTTTTTTTESYEEPVQPLENQFNQHVNTNINYQNIPSRQQHRNHNQHRLVENTHFTASVPQNKYNVQTERADIGFQTTERLLPTQTEEQFIQQNINKGQLNSQLNLDNQFNQPTLSQGSEANAERSALRYQFQQSQAGFFQPNTNVEQSNFNISNPQSEFDYVPASQQDTPSQYTDNQFQQVVSQREVLQQPLNPQQPQMNFQQENLDLVRPVGQVSNQAQQSYFEQLTLQQQQQQESQPIVQEQSQTQNQQQYENDQQLLLLAQEKARDTTDTNHGLQGQHISTTGQFKHVVEVTVPPPQETPVQTTQTETSHSQVEDEPQTQQYNQQRLIKYNRPHSRIPVTVDTSSNEEQTTNPRRGQYQYQPSVESSDDSGTEDATTKSSLVRVRGRVRSRQRGSTRNYQTTTTEAPNYPTTYLSRQRNSQDREESQENSPRKRVNYSTRQTFSSSRNNNNNKEVNPDQNISELTYASTEKQSTSERFLDYTDVSTTTTTEAPTTKSMRRYQHILNRNKVRRTRPTSAPSSGSSGATKFLLPTTAPPVTRLSSSRGRIRKPVSTTTTTSTTEYPQVNPSWNERDNFAPSAGSNEILEPLYQTRDKAQPSFSGFQQTLGTPTAPQRTSPKPDSASADDNDFWNQAVTIQQSTSFDFKPDGSAVTPPSFQANSGQFEGTFSPIWNGQIELQDGNYYDVFNQQQVARNVNDQTPFSSDHQKIVYKEIKNRRPVGKENQYTEKAYEVKKPAVTDVEEDVSGDRIYPVYREIIKPAESIQQETSHVIVDPYEVEGKSLHEKGFNEPTELQAKIIPEERAVNSEAESENKEGALKRKISATNSGKKHGRRRGSWVRVRVRKPQDMFETAESQNLASLSENAIKAVTKSLNDKVTWTSEPSTELPQTTTTEIISEPAETVSEPSDTINLQQIVSEQTDTINLQESVSEPTETIGEPTETTDFEEAVSEPAETINFEEALKDMLKEFITNSEEENREEANTETSKNPTYQKDTINTTVTTQLSKQGEEVHQTQSDTLEKQNVEDETTLQNEETSKSKSASEDRRIKQEEKPVKTAVPEVTTEMFMQEPTTIFQTIENVETTLEPEVTTTPNELVYKSQHSRVLGTSTTTEISLETEICYRGRCVKTKKAEGNSDLLTTE